MSLRLRLMARVYRVLRTRLETELRAAYPPHTVVEITKGKSYIGPGLVQPPRDDMPPDHIAVLCESGNVWWYHVECVTGVVGVRDWPRWIRRYELRRRLHNAQLRQLAIQRQRRIDSQRQQPSARRQSEPGNT